MGTIVEPAQSNREADSATRLVRIAEHHIAEHIEYQTNPDPGSYVPSLLFVMPNAIAFKRLMARFEA